MDRDQAPVSTARGYVAPRGASVQKWSWKWGYGTPPPPRIAPAPWKPAHLIGDAYENDLRRRVWGYWLLAVFPFVPMVVGVAAGAADVLRPDWAQTVEVVSAVVVLLASVMAFVGFVLRTRNTAFPESVASLLPIAEERQ